MSDVPPPPVHPPDDIRAGNGSTAGAPPVDCVLTHHLNTYASGVARFNEILAERLGVPLLSVFSDAAQGLERPLLSFKLGELDEAEQHLLTDTLDRSIWRHDVYLHDWRGLPLEERLVRESVRCWAGNLEVLEQVEAIGCASGLAWTPGLLLDQRTFSPAEVSVFSFGMAHKLRTDMFRQLRGLLERSGRSYRLYVSTANHETSSLREAELVYEEMHELFPRGLYFMGNLSDVAVYNYLQTTTFFAAFFARGLRANNTSVAAAMEQGCVVITNLDEHSPAHLRHGVNVIDIDKCEELPSDPLTLKRLSVAAIEAAREHSWERLAEVIGGTSPEPVRADPRS
jgi:hypothetical protein